MDSETTPGSSKPPEPGHLRADAAFPELYGELRAIARRALGGEEPSSSLRPTAVVHEVYLRMRQQVEATFHDHHHFLATAAMLMRRVLVDHARARGRVKRGASGQHVSLDNALQLAAKNSELILEIDEALTRLECEHDDARVAQVVVMKFFGGMTELEIAGELGISDRYVRKLWSWGRVWLREQLAEG